MRHNILPVASYHKLRAAAPSAPSVLALLLDASRSGDLVSSPQLLSWICSRSEDGDLALLLDAPLDFSFYHKYGSHLRHASPLCEMYLRARGELSAGSMGRPCGMGLSAARLLAYESRWGSAGVDQRDYYISACLIPLPRPTLSPIPLSAGVTAEDLCELAGRMPYGSGLAYMLDLATCGYLAPSIALRDYLLREGVSHELLLASEQDLRTSRDRHVEYESAVDDAYVAVMSADTWSQSAPGALAYDPRVGDSWDAYGEEQGTAPSLADLVQGAVVSLG